MEVRERYYRTLDSTNNEAKKAGPNPLPGGDGHLRRAARRRAEDAGVMTGRRPRMKRWATSMILYPDIPPEHLPGLTLLAAVAVRRGNQRALWAGRADQVAERCRLEK